MIPRLPHGEFSAGRERGRGQPWHGMVKECYRGAALADFRYLRDTMWTCHDETISDDYA